MASGGKKKTTMAKLAREHKLRERRVAKAARKEARKNAPGSQEELSGLEAADDGDAIPGATASPSETSSST